MFSKYLISVEDVLVRREIAETPFACNLDKCKGACCTLESEFGAPLLHDEIDILNEALEVIRDYLPENHKKVIEEQGFSCEKKGELMTLSVDNKACVFVIFENGIAKCAIEKAFLDGKIDFRKPISCHLFPIRISNLGGDVLRYEKFSECEPALENGKTENLTIAEFCEGSLTRLYGKQWYVKFMKTIGK
jgi:hypothetical protein